MYHTPNPTPRHPAPHPPALDPHAALDELLRRIDLHRITGSAYLRLDANQGGVRQIKIGTEETFQST